MRRFKIGSAKALVWAAVSLASGAGEVRPALAQTFDFTFSGATFGNSALIQNGMLTLDSSTTSVTSATGMLSGVSPSTYDGAFSLNIVAGGDYYNSPSDYNFEFRVNVQGNGEALISLDPGVNDFGGRNPRGQWIRRHRFRHPNPRTHPRLRPAVLPRVRRRRPVDQPQAVVAGGSDGGRLSRLSLLCLTALVRARASRLLVSPSPSASRHCEQSEAIQGPHAAAPGLLRRKSSSQ